MAKPSSAGICSSCGVYAQKRYGGMGRYPVVCLDCWIVLGEDDSRTSPTPASAELRERVARALYHWQIAFERKHWQRVAHPAWEVGYADYWGPLANAVLTSLGLDDLDAAIERGARRLLWEECVQWEDDPTDTARGYALSNARAVLEAALTSPDAS